MKKTILCLVIPLLAGCSMVRDLKAPPFPYAVVHHTRATGMEASVPNQAGDALLKFRLGWFSDTTTLIPCATNALGNMTAAPISDTFRLDNSISFMPSTKITEDMVSGWKGTPPTPRHRNLFGPVDRSLPECPCPPAPAPNVTTPVPTISHGVTNAWSEGFSITFPDDPSGATVDAMLFARMKPTADPKVWRLEKYDFTNVAQADAIYRAMAERAVLKR